MYLNVRNCDCRLITVIQSIICHDIWKTEDLHASYGRYTSILIHPAVYTSCVLTLQFCFLLFSVCIYIYCCVD